MIETYPTRDDLFWHKHVLVTGGGGSIGSSLTLKLLEQKGIGEVIAFDNNEYALACLREKTDEESLQIAYGDIRDSERLKEVLKDVEIVVHAAALKRIEMAELNIVEAIKVNVLGTINLLQECRNAKVKKLLLISSDKAVPTEEGLSNYGTTKLMQERIVLSGSPLPTCAVARFGNVIQTRGNVFEIWEKQKRERKPLSLTHPDIKRFFWTMEEAIDFIMACLEHMQHGDLFIPNMQEQKVIDVAKKLYGTNVKMEHVGLRLGESLTHKLMTAQEKEAAVPVNWGWVIKRLNFFAMVG